MRDRRCRKERLKVTYISYESCMTRSHICGAKDPDQA